MQRIGSPVPGKLNKMMIKYQNLQNSTQIKEITKVYLTINRKDVDKFTAEGSMFFPSRNVMIS